MKVLALVLVLAVSVQCDVAPLSWNGLAFNGFERPIVFNSPLTQLGLSTDVAPLQPHAQFRQFGYTPSAQFAPSPYVRLAPAPIGASSQFVLPSTTFLPSQAGFPTHSFVPSPSYVSDQSLLTGAQSFFPTQSFLPGLQSFLPQPSFVPTTQTFVPTTSSFLPSQSFGIPRAVPTTSDSRYIAANPGSVHITDLPGHDLSTSSLNLDSAPGAPTHH